MALDTIINLKNVTVYQKNHLVLSDVTFNICKGEFAYLIGKTGSGKSSLMKVLYADLPMRDGTAIVAGYDLQNIRNKDIPWLRRKIGIIFQDFHLLHDRTVQDNLIFVMKATGWKQKQEMEERMQEVLNWVGLGTKGFKMPHQLSGGEQQRVVIARALINKPDIILADEPTGNLDPETSKEILGLIFELRKTGRAIIMATHDYSLMNDFPARVLKCEAGKVFELEMEHAYSQIPEELSREETEKPGNTSGADTGKTATEAKKEIEKGSESGPQDEAEKQNPDDLQK